MTQTQSRLDKLAVLIDADNVAPAYADKLFSEVAKYGTATIKRAYGDWTTPELTRWKNLLNQFAIQPIQQDRNTVGKNATDIAMVIDAMDLLHSCCELDGFCLVSSDSDFTRLAIRIRESGLIVYGFGEQKTPEALVAACDKFIYQLPPNKQPPTNPPFPTQISPNSPLKKGGTVPVKKPSKAKTTNKLTRNTQLVNLLKSTIDAVADKNGWASLGQVGQKITAKKYGYKKLIDLINATQLFEIKKHKSVRYKRKN
jgi:uncharacterized LabA/DUF88 family protein